MRKLSEIRGENALDVLADLLEPISEIATDKKFVQFLKNGDRMNACVFVLREHKKAVLKTLAIVEGVKPEEYNPTLIELPIRVLELLNDPDLAQVFTSAGLGASSGSATGSTGETAEG